MTDVKDLSLQLDKHNKVIVVDMEEVVLVDP